MKSTPTRLPSATAPERIGSLAIECGYIEPDQLAATLQEQTKRAKMGSPIALGQLFLEKNLLTLDPLLHLLKLQGRSQVRCPGCGAKGIDLHTAGLEPMCLDCKKSSPLESWVAQDAMSLGPGVLLGRYRIESELGRGGMGVVFRATDMALKRTVALKVLAPGMEQESTLSRFYREGAMMARLTHPGIVQVYEVGVTEGIHHLAMQFVDGTTLEQFTAQKKPSLSHAARIMLQVADAVGFAHFHKIIHRDLKPSNVLIAKDGRVLVGDFGLARSQASQTMLTVSGSILGTPAYMPPEAFWGGRFQVGPHSDVFSLGVMMYELVTGHLPFPGTTLYEIMELIQAGDPLPPRRHRPDLPKSYEAVILKAMHPEPLRRYRNAVEFAADLKRLCRGEPVVAQGFTPLSRFIFRARKKWRLWSSVAAIVLLAAGIATQAWRLHRQEGQASTVIEQLTLKLDLENWGRELRSKPHDLVAEIRNVKPQLDELKKCEAYETVGRLCSALGLVDDAIEAWEKAVQGGHSQNTSRIRLVEAYLTKHDLETSRASLFEDQTLRDTHIREAEKWLDKAREALAHASSSPYVEVLSAYLGSDPSQTEKLARRQILQDETSDTLYRILGNLSRKNKNWDQAMAWYDRAYDLNKSDWRTMILGAEVRISKAENVQDLGEELETATAYCDQAQRIKSDEGAVFTLRCHARIHMAQTAGIDVETILKLAVDDGEKGVLYGPARPEAHQMRGVALSRTGELLLQSNKDPSSQFQSAIQAYRRAVELDPRNEMAWQNIALCHIRLAKWFRADPLPYLKSALEICQDGIRRFPRSPLFHHDLGSVWLNLGHAYKEQGEDPLDAYRRALEAFREAVRMDPQYDLAHHNTGVVYHAMARLVPNDSKQRMEYLSAALRAFETALSLNSHHWQAWQGKAKVLRNLGRLEEARGAAIQANKINPSHKGIQHLLRDLQTAPKTAGEGEDYD